MKGDPTPTHPRHKGPILGRQVPIAFGFANQWGLAFQVFTVNGGLIPSTLKVSGLSAGRVRG